MSHLGLGTVQFGMPYGISNNQGQTPPHEIAAILNLAREFGIGTLDTAAAYGTSEAALGSALEGTSCFRIVTKTVELDATAAPDALLETTFERSLVNLRQPAIYGLLVHNVDDLLGAHGDIIWKSLKQLQLQGLVSKIGVSVYTGEQIDALLQRFDPCLVQLPINVVDQRLITSGHLKKLKSRNIEIHARSVFLQGLLLMRHEDRPPQFHRVEGALAGYTALLENYSLTPLQATLSFIRQVPEIDVALVGVNTASQLQECLEAFRNAAPVPDYSSAASDEEFLLNPALWYTNAQQKRQVNG